MDVTGRFLVAAPLAMPPAAASAAGRLVHDRLAR